MLGGLSEIKPVDTDIEIILKSVKSHLEEKLGKELYMLKGDSYKTQVVAGVNYFIKAQIEENSYIIIKVFRDLPNNHNPDKLVSVNVQVKREDNITFFE